jgi:serine/threonine protein kinase
VNQILTVQDNLGKGTSAIVHSVKCRRILLARKTIYTNKHFTKRQAIEEVAHLTRLKHSHIVRLIGTYTWKKELSILMYPVADYNLTTFLDILDNASVDERSWVVMATASFSFFACLSSALEYIHRSFTKHMDIKPHNILVRKSRQNNGRIGPDVFKVYISDFGIARSYQSLEATNTDAIHCVPRSTRRQKLLNRTFAASQQTFSRLAASSSNCSRHSTASMRRTCWHPGNVFT